MAETLASEAWGRPGERGQAKRRKQWDREKWSTNCGQQTCMEKHGSTSLPRPGCLQWERLRRLSTEHCTIHSTWSTHALRLGSWTGKASSFSKKNAPSNCSPVTYWRGITKGNTSWVFLMGKSLFCNFHVYGVCMYMHVFTCRGTHVCVHLEASGLCWKSSLITLFPYLWRQGLLIKPRVSLYG